MRQALVEMGGVSALSAVSCRFALTQHSNLGQLEYLLVDGVNPGSGESFDWDAFEPPRAASLARGGWLLAGGLAPSNVATAASSARPDGVDVASGTADDSGVRKDHEKVRAFVDNARAAVAA